MGCRGLEEDCMRKMMIAAFGAASLLMIPSCAQEAAPVDPFAGTWKTDLASVQIDDKPKEYLLKDGVYACSSCVPPLSVKADGGFHAVAGRTSFDSISVKVVDDRTLGFVHRLGDRVVGNTTMAVSPDGNSLTMSVTETTDPNAPPTTAKATDTRVAAAPAGAHAVSGSWKTAVNRNMPDEALTFSFRIEGDTVHLKAPGQSYAAKLDGTEAPVEADVEGTMVSVERLAPNILRETYKRDGKVVRVTTMTIADDGTMNGASENKVQGSTTKYSARKI